MSPGGRTIRAVAPWSEASIAIEPLSTTKPPLDISSRRNKTSPARRTSVSAGKSDQPQRFRFDHGKCRIAREFTDIVFQPHAGASPGRERASPERRAITGSAYSRPPR